MDSLRIGSEAWLSGLYTVLGVATLVTGLATENSLFGLERRLVTEETV